MDLLKTDSYDYILPEELIAKYPSDNSRLLIYNRDEDKIIHTNFSNIINFIPKCSIFFNDTKVIKARIYGKKETGGKIELLVNKVIDDNFLVYIKGKVKVGTKLFFDNLVAKVISLYDDGSRLVEFFYKNKKIDFIELVEILDKIGHIPLPPYINRADEEDDKNHYQSLFAKKYGAVAAPTASLHFNKQLLEDINKKFDTYFITLHVGAGTFKGVEVENILEHNMHSEYFEIPQKSRKILDSNEKILAVGTTVTRTIEYYYHTKKTNGECDIFLHPKNPPKRVNYLLTNFHLPKSTLIMLVASFIGLDKTKEIYQEAIKNKYRFFSYGDAMLII